MAIINKRYGYIFLAEPRTASRSVARALTLQKGSKGAGSHHILIEALINYRYLRAAQRKQYTTFCFVRNPCDALVSLWLNTKTTLGFSRFMQEYLTGDTEHFFFRHADRADCVLHYENLQGDLNEFLRGKGAPTVELPLIGETPDKKHWTEYYEKRELEEMVVCFPEIKKWGYGEIIQQIIDEI